MAAGSGFAWPSVAVYRGGSVIHRRAIIKCEWSDNFGALIERIGSNFESQSVTEVTISSNETPSNADMTHTVPLDAPITLLETYHCHYVNYYLAPLSSSTDSTTQQPQPNALAILMQNAERIVLPPVSTNIPASEQQLRGDIRLRNDFIHYLEIQKVGWSPGIVSTTGEQFVKMLTLTLWYLDPHHQQLMDR